MNTQDIASLLKIATPGKKAISSVVQLLVAATISSKTSSMTDQSSVFQSNNGTAISTATMTIPGSNPDLIGPELSNQPGTSKLRLLQTSKNVLLAPSLNSAETSLAISLFSTILI